jgi:hypothetical protein
LLPLPSLPPQIREVVQQRSVGVTDGLPNKVLVFSQSVRMLEILKVALAGLGAQTYTGEQNKAVRDAMIRAFQDPYNTAARVLLVSTLAGGTGLTLSLANRCDGHVVYLAAGVAIGCFFLQLRAGSASPPRFCALFLTTSLPDCLQRRAR